MLMAHHSVKFVRCTSLDVWNAPQPPYAQSVTQPTTTYCQVLAVFVSSATPQIPPVVSVSHVEISWVSALPVLLNLSARAARSDTSSIPPIFVRYVQFSWMAVCNVHP